MIRVLLDTDVILDLVLAHSLRSALALSMSDYEDAVQVAAATSYQLNAVVTRNTKDYANAPLSIFSPPDFLKQISMA